MAILNNSNAISVAGAYDINNSLRFRSSASAFLNRTPGSAGNRRTWTWSAWVKLGSLSSTKILFSACTAGDSTGLAGLQFTSSNTLQFFLDTGATGYSLITTQVFRDPSAWYHIVAVLDTTQATSTNRMKLYINGSQITAFGTATYPSLNDSYAVNNTQAHNIGRYAIDGTRYFDGYLAEVNLIDGQSLTPTSFGETDTTTGVWKPKAYTSTYGTNGFYLKFSDIATTSGSNAGLGKDFSGNANYWTTNNINVTTPASTNTSYDAMIDSPTLTSATVANYAVLNPLDVNAVTSITEANLYSSLSASASAIVRSTIAITSGKWYWEVKFGTTGDTLMVGVCDATTALTNSLWSTTNAWMYYSNNGNKYNSSSAAYGATFTNGDIIGVALDMDAGTLVFYKNNVSQGTAYNTGLTGKTLTPTIQSAARALTAYINFGQRPFEYTPPTGFVALNTYNLPTPTILQGNKYMDATLYTGTRTTNVIVNQGQFKPDAIWIKTRSAGAYNHHLVDSVRGTTKNLRPNTTGAEDTVSDQITAINSNGFTLGVDTAGPADSEVNVNGNTYVAWQWQAGQGSTSSNTAGSITSTVSVNTTAGFSVVTYTGTGANATVGHGLGVAPKMVIVKRRDNGIGATNWWVYHAGVNNGVNPQQYNLKLNLTNAQAGLTAAWNDTAPTSSVFTVGTTTEINGSGGTFVAYTFSEISGFSKFGSYTGNGSADGPFVATNFKPKFVMIKVTSTTNVWLLIDATRNPYNVANLNLNANDSAAENTASTGAWLDFTSNGFKIRNGSDSAINSNGATYVYACFASHPFKNSNAV